MQTDPGPKISISQNTIRNMQPGLQRLFSPLLKYYVVMRYVPGTQLFDGDILSRTTAAAPEYGRGSTDDIEIYAVTIVAAFLSDVTLKRLAKGSDKDPYLSTVIQSICSNTCIDQTWFVC